MGTHYFCSIGRVAHRVLLLFVFRKFVWSHGHVGVPRPNHERAVQGNLSRVIRRRACGALEVPQGVLGRVEPTGSRRSRQILGPTCIKARGDADKQWLCVHVVWIICLEFG